MSLRIVLLLFGILCKQIGDLEATKDEKLSGPTSSVPPYSTSQLSYSTQIQHSDDLESDASRKIKDISESGEDKIMRSYRSHHSENFEVESQEEIRPHSSHSMRFSSETVTKKPTKNRKVQFHKSKFLIKIPNQKFHEHALSSGPDSDYQAYFKIQSAPIQAKYMTNMSVENHFDRAILSPHFEALTAAKQSITAPTTTTTTTTTQQPLLGYSVHEERMENEPPCSAAKQINTNQYNTNIQHNENRKFIEPTAIIRQINNQMIPRFEALIGNFESSTKHYHQEPTKQPEPSTTVHIIPSVETTQRPRFEALSPNYHEKSILKKSKKHKAHHHTTSYAAPIDERIATHAHHETSSEKHQHASIPIKAVLLNHKVYHEENYNKRLPYEQPIRESTGKFKASIPIIAFNSRYGFRPLIRSRLGKYGSETRQLIQNGAIASKLQESLPQFFINVEDKVIGRSSQQNNKRLARHVREITRSSASSGEDSSDEVDQNRNQKDAAARAISEEIRYFQDIYLAHNSPHDTEFGHVLESPKSTEERFESNDRANHRYKGKVKWTDRNGQAGQYLWDLGHLGRK